MKAYASSLVNAHSLCLESLTVACKGGKPGHPCHAPMILLSERALSCCLLGVGGWSISDTSKRARER